MTLILSYVRPRFVLQVSDRLLTDQHTGRSLDRIADKSIVFLADDGLVTMSHSGSAVVGGTPLTSGSSNS